MAVEPEHASVNGQKPPERPPRPQRSPRDVADELRARIRAGALRPGERMPTQARLAEEFGVERGAVRQALRILDAKRRRGTICPRPFPAHSIVTRTVFARMPRNSASVQLMGRSTRPAISSRQSTACACGMSKWISR